MILARDNDISADLQPVGTLGHGRQAHKKANKTELHRLLRVSADEHDPVMIILAAQIQLRRWRRAEPGKSPSRIRQRIREITAARDLLLKVQTRPHAGKPF
jgi:hypothetical protein